MAENMQNFITGIIIVGVILIIGIYISSDLQETFREYHINYIGDNQTWLSFDGINDNVTIPDADQYSPYTTGEIAVSFWMYVPNWSFSGQSATSEYINFLAKKKYDGGNDCEWEFRMENSTGMDGYVRPCRLSFYVFNKTCGEGAGAYVQNNATIDTCQPQMIGNWINIVGGMGLDNETYIYVNNIKNAYSSANNINGYDIELHNGVGKIEIGKDLDSSGKNLNASIDNIKIYNRSLDSGDVQQLYESGRNDINIIKTNYNDTWLNFTNQEYVETTFTNYSQETTFSIWYYKTYPSNEQVLLGSKNYTGIILRVSQDDGIKFFPNVTAGYFKGSSISTDNVWNNVVVTWNNTANNATIYMNGVYKGSGIITSNYTQGLVNDNMLIGKRDNSASSTWEGKLDELRIYSRILTPTEILEINQSGRIGRNSYLSFSKIGEPYNATFVRVNHTDYHSPYALDLINATQFSYFGWFKSNNDLTDLGNEWNSYAIFKPKNTFLLGWSGYSHDGWECNVWNQSSTTVRVAVWKTYPLVKDEWHYIGCVFNGTGLELYIDGVLEASNYSGIDGTWNYSTGDDHPIYGQYFDLFIGSKNQYPYYNLTFNGSIDEVRVYNRSLSAEEILTNYNSGIQANSALNATQLLGWWNFNIGNGSSIIDNSGNGFTASLWEGNATSISGIPTTVGWVTDYPNKYNTPGLQLYYPMDEGDYNGTLFDSSGNGVNGTINGATWANDGIVTSTITLPLITNGLVGEWKLDEGTGTKAIDNIFGNNGTISGATWFYNYSIITTYTDSNASTAAGDLVTALSGGTAWITILVVVGFAVIVLGMLTSGLGRAAEGTGPVY